mmetsp:Transcript_38123/g.60353  ORF Transcript_38123/g.60353 Transcript_38123/m.60353 type:complete len:389 (-) Transcript_38123:18-1184(-)
MSADGALNARAGDGHKRQEYATRKRCGQDGLVKRRVHEELRRGLDELRNFKLLCARLRRQADICYTEAAVLHDRLCALTSQEMSRCPRRKHRKRKKSHRINRIGRIDDVRCSAHSSVCEHERESIADYCNEERSDSCTEDGRIDKCCRENVVALLQQAGCSTLNSEESEPVHDRTLRGEVVGLTSLSVDAAFRSLSLAWGDIAGVEQIAIAGEDADCCAAAEREVARHGLLVRRACLPQIRYWSTAIVQASSGVCGGIANSFFPLQSWWFFALVTGGFVRRSGVHAEPSGHTGVGCRGMAVYGHHNPCQCLNAADKWCREEDRVGGDALQNSVRSHVTLESPRHSYLELVQSLLKRPRGDGEVVAAKNEEAFERPRLGGPWGQDKRQE